MLFDKICGFASLLGLVLTVTGWLTTSSNVKVFWLAVMIPLLLLSLFYLCKYNTTSKYLNGQEKVRDLHNQIALQHSQVYTKNLEEIVPIMADLCTDISEAFESIKGVKISVCIKYINGDIDNPYVKTLCRDTHSRRRRYQNPSAECDYVWQNSDFAHILRAFNKKCELSELYYLANDLPNQHQYTNTHLSASDHQSVFLQRFRRRKQWPLPYKSTIVVPFISSDNKQVDGFLCIDSPFYKVFNKSRDVAILQQIALFMRELMYYVCSNHLNAN